MSYHDVKLSEELKPFVKGEEEELLLKMWTLIAKRNHYKRLVDTLGICSESHADASQILSDTKKELAIQRKITLGSIYHSNRSLWRYLTSHTKDISILG